MTQISRPLSRLVLAATAALALGAAGCGTSASESSSTSSSSTSSSTTAVTTTSTSAPSADGTDAPLATTIAKQLMIPDTEAACVADNIEKDLGVAAARAAFVSDTPDAAALAAVSKAGDACIKGSTLAAVFTKNMAPGMPGVQAADLTALENCLGPRLEGKSGTALLEIGQSAGDAAKILAAPTLGDALGNCLKPVLAASAAQSAVPSGTDAQKACVRAAAEKKLDTMTPSEIIGAIVDQAKSAEMAASVAGEVATCLAG